MCLDMDQCDVLPNGNSYFEILFFVFFLIFKWVFSFARGHVTEPILKGSKSVDLALMGCARQKK